MIEIALKTNSLEIRVTCLTIMRKLITEDSKGFGKEFFRSDLLNLFGHVLHTSNDLSEIVSRVTVV